MLQILCLIHLTIVFREAHAEMSFLDLLNKHVFLVEEEYNGGCDKIAVVADTVEQMQTLVHSILKMFYTKTEERPIETSQLLIFPKKKQIVSYRICVRYYCYHTTSSSSTRTISKALKAPMKMIQVTPSKQWIHFFLSDLWPPTSNILHGNKHIIFMIAIQHTCTTANELLLPSLWEILHCFT